MVYKLCFKNIIKTFTKYFPADDLSAQNIPSAKIIILHGERGYYIQPTTASVQAKQYREISEMAFQFFKKALKYSDQPKRLSYFLEAVLQ